MTPCSFGSLPSGEAVEVYTLSNASGASVDVMTYGATVTSLRMPDREGRFDDVVLGFSDLPGYLAATAYFGAIVGRVAGRVGHGKILVGGETYSLACNEGQHHLHGGNVGLDRRLWTAHPSEGADSLRLTYESPDGEEGYPGNVSIAVTYRLTAANELVVETEAVSDRPTPLVLTQHSYLNLAGESSRSTENHEVQIFADFYVPVGGDLLLSGQSMPVDGLPNDLRQPRRLRDFFAELGDPHGEFYVLREPGALAARVLEPRSGRVLSVRTDEPCLQFYTASSLGPGPVGRSGHAYKPFSGLCLECQGYPGGSERPEFGDVLVHPQTPQRRRTVYAFSAE